MSSPPAGCTSIGGTVWLALALWITMLLGESGLFAQSTVWQAAWCAAFGLPYAYMQCRRVADALVEEALGAASTLLLQVSCPCQATPCWPLCVPG